MRDHAEVEVDGTSMPGSRGSDGSTWIVAAKPARARIGFLDGFRAIAAGAVVIQHAFSVSSIAALRSLTDYSPGVFGVVLFFLVSGFAIPLSIGSRFDLRTFAVRRVFRIFPATLAATALWALLSSLGAISDGLLRQATAADWLANLILIPDYVGAPSFLGVTWTLPLEFAWYVAFAFALIVFRRAAPLVMEVAAPAGMLLLSLAALALDQRIPVGRIGMLYAAVLGYQAYRFHVGEISWRRFSTATAIFLLVMTVANYIAFGIFRHPTITRDQALYPWIVAPLLFYWGIWDANRGGDRLSRSAFLSWLGVVSFSMYLVHPIAISVIEPRLAGIPSLVAVFALTLLLSALGYYGVERPGMRLGRRLAHRPDRMPRALTETI